MTEISYENTIFLFGAGLSLSAGVPSIKEMTKKFLENPFCQVSEVKRQNEFNFTKNHIETLVGLTSKYYGVEYPDLELLLSFISQMEDSSFKRLFMTAHPDAKEIASMINDVKLLINDYIRKECENIDRNANYLWPLTGMSDPVNGLNIFTLNYDGVVETFCETNNLSYSDGFDPYWNPQHFDGKIVKVFKLHGSLFWFKTEKGKVIKIPAKGLDITNLRYLSDESLSEMMIYPTLQKKKDTEIYLWIRSKFLSELKKARTCIVVGYSFRDKDIREVVLSSMNANPDLWLVLVSPSASQHKKSYFNGNLDISSRILAIDRKVEDVIEKRIIREYIDSLNSTRGFEMAHWKEQASSCEPLRQKLESRVISETKKLVLLTLFLTRIA